MIGTLENVEMRYGGGILTAVVAAGATALPLDITLDYEEAGGVLELNGESYAYTEVAEESVTLATPLLADAEEGDPAWTLDAQGRREESWAANVDLRDGGEPVPAEIPTTLIPFFPEGDDAAGQDVEVEDTPDGYRVRSRPGQMAQFDNAFSYDPILFAHRPAATTSWPHAAWTEVAGYTITEQADITYAGAGWWVFNTPGLYQAIGTVAFENVSGAGGARGVRFIFPAPGAGAQSGTTVILPANADVAGAFTGLQVVQWRRFVAGDQIQMQAWQSSGAALDLLGAADGSRTSVSVRRMSA